MTGRASPLSGRCVFASAVVLFAAAWATPCPGDVSLRWEVQGDQTRAVVDGLGTSWFADHDRESWKVRLQVFSEAILEEAQRLPMLGKYGKDDGKLVFTPLFPLQAGLAYEATFSVGEGGADPLTATYRAPEPQGVAPTVVSRIYPSAEVLPENLLKFYVHFSAPMSRGRIYDHIHLTDGEGRQIELPFLEIDEELWDHSMTRVTLFIDPGRIKRGVKPLEEIGPALEAGKAYTLTIDAAWRDAQHRPLKEPYHKHFRVGSPDRRPPDPTAWQISAVTAGTREPLRIGFDGTMDHALALRMIHVVHQESSLRGEASLADAEQTWSFEPAEAWESGDHAILVQTAIEDLAGNNVGKPFEVDLEGPVERRLTERSVRVGFTVDPR